MTDCVEVKSVGCSFLSPAHLIEVENEDSTASGSQASTLSLKKKVNIADEMNKGLRKRDNEDSDLDVEQIQETTALNQSEGVISNCTDENYLTLTGTIKRGKKAGQNVDVKVNISREEFDRLESTKAKLTSSTYESCQRDNKLFYQCGLAKGLHILVWTFICFPFVFIASSIYSFYIGTFCWYNVFSWYTEEKAFLCRIFMPPFLIICYPFVIMLTSLGLGIYAAFEQISWSWYTWRGRVVDLEKGFYAYLCLLIHLEECSPYTEVVIVDQLHNVAS